MRWGGALRVLTIGIATGLLGVSVVGESSGQPMAKSLPLTVRISASSKSALRARVTVLTAPRGLCRLTVSVRSVHATLPRIRADKSGRAGWQWLIPGAAPSGVWTFAAGCQVKGIAHSASRRENVITPSTKATGAVGVGDSFSTTSGKVAGLGGDGNPFPWHQCTWEAWEMRRDIYQAGVSAGIPAGGSRGVSQGVTVYVWDGMMWYPNAQKAGLAVGSTPKKNALVSFGPYAGNPYGHVAYVNDVVSPTRILVTQCNGFTLACGDAWINPQAFPGGLEGYIYGGKATPPPPAPFNPAAYNGHIVKQDNGNAAAWLVTDGHRNWIPDAATYNCLKSQGHPGPDLLSAAQLNQLPDQTGIWATCSSTPPPPPPPSKDTTPPTTPSGFAQIDNSQTAVRVQWSPSTDNVGVTGYDLYVNNNQVSSNATSSFVIGGLSCGQSYSLAVDAYDAAGNHSGKATTAGTTQGCPLPSPSVSVSKGAHYTTSTCTASACALVVVTFSNFGGGSHTVGCYADDPYPYDTTHPYYTYTTSSTTSAVCVYGYPGYHVWAKVDGVESNHYTW
jgi:surface antigen